MYDVIIIGKGPAGISASLYTKRNNLNTLVIGKDKGALLKAERIDNYYGELEINGLELARKGIKQAKDLGVEVIEDEALGISWDSSFNVTTKNDKYESKALIIATGSNRIAPIIKGVKEFEGKGISYCAICDGFFYKQKDVAVLGSGDYAVHEAMQLLPLVNSITILTNGKEIVENRLEDLKINDKQIKEIRGEGKVSKVEFLDNTSISVDGIFIAEGTASSIDFARSLGILTEDNKIVVNSKMETNIQGLYACGDCTGGLFQISKAVYEGAEAGISVSKYLKDKAK